MKRIQIILLMMLWASLSLNATSACYLPDMGQPAVIFTCSGASNVGEAEFSLSETKKIVFAKGNLQYRPSTGTWRIAPRQYDFVGGNNKKDYVPNGQHGTIWQDGTRSDNTTNNRNASYSGWLDTFLWGTSDWYGDDEGENRNLDMTARKEVNPHKKVTANPYNYTGDINAACFVLNGSGSQGFTGDYAMADWGVRNNAALGGTEEYFFRTPTKQEFDYVLNSRDNAESLRARGHIRLSGIGVDDKGKPKPDTLVNGLILLPDEWHPSILPTKPIITDAEGNELYENNELTVAEWQLLELNGAIFLPATGSTSKFNRSGFYWSSTSQNNNSAWNIEFGGYGATGSTPHMQGATKASARAVRLVMEPRTPGAPTLPVVTKTCDDYEKVDVPGTGGTITSTQDESDHCLWHLTATPDEGYKFAYWIDLYGVKTYTENTDFYIDTNVSSEAMQAVFVRSNAYIHEWNNDNIVYRADTSNILHGSNQGYGTLVIDNEAIELENDDIIKSDFGVWKQEFSSELDGNIYAGKNVHYVLFDACHKPSAVFDAIMPVMIYGDSLASDVDFHADVAHTDVQVFDGAVLTIDDDIEINGYLDIHAGGKVIVAEGYTLTVNGIVMRGDGIRKKWPQLEVDGSIINNNNDTIYYDYTLDQHAYYPLTLPFEVNCSEVYNPINKAAASYQAYIYNTENRENSVYAWDEFDDTVLGAKFVAGKGYIVYAVPTKWRGVKALRQQEAVVRFPMVADFSDGGEAEKLVDIYSNPSGEVYDCSNWNLIGNPYLKNITMGHVNVGKYRAYQGNLDGEGNFVEAAPPGSRSLNYITYSDDGFRSYQHEELSNFVMKPFNSYLTQTSVGSKLQFAKITTPLAAPRRAQTSSEEDVEVIRTGLLLSQGDEVDHIGLLFGDYTYDYEVNADLAKQFGEAQPMSVYSLMGNIPMAYQALPIDAMNRPVPVGYRKADITSMTFSFDDSRYAREQIEELWLTDLVTGQTVNLLDEDYTFTPESAQDDSRFYLSCERRKVVEIATDVEETTQQQTIIRVFDMFGREMHGDVNALPQGVYILMDNLGNTKKEILGQ